MARSQLPVAQIGASLTQLAEMTHSRRGNHHHPGSAVMDSPAQFGVLAVVLDDGIEAAQLAEQIGPHQQIRRRQHEDIADPVVLFLIDLPDVDDRVDLAESVHAQSDRLQHVRIVPVDELGPDGAGIRAVELLDQDPQRIGFGCDVVVADQEEPVVTLDEAQHFVRRRSEPDVGTDGAHERSGHPVLDPFVDRFEACGVAVGDVVDHEEEHT